MKKQFAVSAIFFAAHFFCYDAGAQLQVSNSAPYNTASYLVQNVLLGSGITISNVTYAGDTAAFGYFKGINSNIGLDSGIIITTGKISNAVGPNSSPSTTFAGSNLVQDPDLTAIATGTVNDAAVLQFDFIPYADTVKFRYVFGSEEYPEWVGSQFNDVFGFFISGPGIMGPYTNNAKNIALIPSTTIPVAINNVNNGTTNTGPCMNCLYYVNNTNGTTVQYDGFTTVLRAISAVQCGQQYHIKIAICDVGDQAYDSGVFLGGGSFSSSGVNVTATIPYGGTNDSTLFEGCGQACLYFVRGNTTRQDTLTVNVSGTATNGVDYVPPIPPQIIFPIGVDSVFFCVSAPNDMITEPLETVIITATLSGACILPISTTVKFYISDHTPMTLSMTPDTTICPSQQVFINANVNGGVPPFSYSWSTGATSQGILVMPSVTTTYTVTVKDSCQAIIQSQPVTVTIPPNISVAVSDIKVCKGNPITMAGMITGGAPNYTCTWTTLSGPVSGIPQNNCTQPYTFIPAANGTYLFTATDRCNRTARDTLDVIVDPNCQVIIPNVFTPNGDGQNDLLVFKNLDHYPNSHLGIYDRWGVRVYENSDYRNDWGGGGTPDGTYYFVLTTSDGKKYNGFIEILSHK